MKIDIIYGTRPELIKLAIPIRKLQSDNQFRVRLISTGQHKEMLEGIEEWFDIKADFSLDVLKPNQSLASLSSSLLAGLNKFYTEEGLPDWIMVQGDTHSAFIGSLTGFYFRVRVAHVEAGLRSFDKLSPYPEEINRQFISKLADVHFCPSMISKANLLDERVKEEEIVVVGNTVIDALLYSRDRIDSLGLFPERLATYFKGNLSGSRLVLITTHRRENFGNNLQSICLAVKELANKNPEVHFILFVHFNPVVKQAVSEVLSDPLPNVVLIPPISYPEFLAVLQRSSFLLTDSGGLQEEAPSFGKPVLLLRTNTERPEGVASGCVKVIGSEFNEIVLHSQMLLDSYEEYRKMVVPENPFGKGNSSDLILNKMKEFE